VLSPLLFAIIVDEITTNTRGLLTEILYADDLVLLMKTMRNFKKFYEWKEVSENKGMTINLGKTKVMVGNK